MLQNVKAHRLHLKEEAEAALQDCQVKFVQKMLNAKLENILETWHKADDFKLKTS